MNRAAFITLGCKINQYETEAIREEVLALGYEEVDASLPADLYVVNTCSVTAEGFAKSRRSILRAARRNPAGKIVVVGCSTSAEKESVASIPQVALVASNDEKHLVGSFLAGEWRPGEPPPRGRTGTWDLRISRFSERTRAVVKVQDGCDSFCSFCLIPFLRGRSRSRPPQEVVEEVRRLVDAGYREVVVSGVHIQDYSMAGEQDSSQAGETESCEAGEKGDSQAGAACGRLGQDGLHGADLAWAGGCGGGDRERGGALAALLERIAGVPGLARIRLSSMGVKAFTPELLDVLENPLFCPHWHLPLQSGSSAVLARMRRDYTAEEFLRTVEALKERFDAPSISTDVIAGYPGETEGDFEATLAVAREAGFSKIHVFPYSGREGTLAAKLRGHIPHREIRRRVGILLELERELGFHYKQRFVGQVVQVLVEARARTNAGAALEVGTRPGPDCGGPRVPARLLEGFTERYVRVRFSEPFPLALARLRGTLQPIRITSADPAVAQGEWVEGIGRCEGEIGSCVQEPPAPERGRAQCAEDPDLGGGDPDPTGRGP